MTQDVARYGEVTFIGQQRGDPILMTPPRITRSYRVDPDVWEAATARADKLGLPMSTVIDRFLRAWVAGLLTLPSERTELYIEPKEDES